MKHMYTVAVLSALFVSLASQTVPTAAAAPAVVDRLSLDRYLGTWYEIASVKPPFQQACACVTANYTLREDGSVQVTNTCRRGGPEGEEVSIRGSALPTDDPAKFSVFFYGPVPSEPNYWVVLLDPDYRFAVVSGGADFTPFWILSRTTALEPEVLSGIESQLVGMGFDLSELMATPQAGCWTESRHGKALSF